MDAEITPTPNGPLQAERIKALKNDRGETIDTAESIFLCRCGQSKNKPYCDGSHAPAGFSDQRQLAEQSGAAEFAGREITVVDDFSLCAHAGECVDGAPETFFTKGPDGRVSHPDASSAEQLIATIKRCPSGALLYKLRGKLAHDYFTETDVRVEKDGPLHVHRAKLNGEARPATEDHYTLCRCGASKNKPFCDGMHAQIKFRDGPV
ncbi:MAG TPA: CDGSH iron-sulfur domain-containing protein [Opitutaceae bacterium]|jgi:CDGSH-type Zn-finger protein|nr:CDGSH iron-sulfur domain-containing protein [Opitutaceae bacterium]